MHHQAHRNISLCAQHHNPTCFISYGSTLKMRETKHNHTNNWDFPLFFIFVSTGVGDASIAGSLQIRQKVCDGVKCPNSIVQKSKNLILTWTLKFSDKTAFLICFADLTKLPELWIGTHALSQWAWSTPLLTQKSSTGHMVLLMNRFFLPVWLSVRWLRDCT